MTISSALAQSELDELTSLLRNGQLAPWDFSRAAIILAGALLAARATRFVLTRFLARRRTDAILGHLAGRVLTYLFAVFGCIYALETRSPPATTRSTLLTVDARTITLRTPDGETVRLPSADVIKQPIVNHTQVGQRRSTVDIGVAYGTDLQQAERVAVAAVRHVEAVHDDPVPPAHGSRCRLIPHDHPVLTDRRLVGDCSIGRATVGQPFQDMGSTISQDKVPSPDLGITGWCSDEGSVASMEAENHNTLAGQMKIGQAMIDHPFALVGVELGHGVVGVETKESGEIGGVEIGESPQGGVGCPFDHLVGQLGVDRDQ